MRIRGLLLEQKDEEEKKRKDDAGEKEKEFAANQLKANMQMKEGMKEKQKMWILMVMTESAILKNEISY